MKTQIFKWALVSGALLLINQNLEAQNWLLGGNTIPATGNVFGTTAASSLKPINIITNGVVRSVVDGVSFNTSYVGNGLGNRLNLNTNNTNYANVAAGRNLGLFAGNVNCKTDPGFPAGDIVMGSRNVYMQPRDVTPGAFLTDGPQRVFIGEQTTTPITPGTPKFLVRGGGTAVSNSSVCSGVAQFTDADNIGLVSQGNFAESPTSSNANKWISLGSRPPSSNVEFDSYGYRSQWNNYAVDLAVQQQTNGAVKDASLTWQDGLTTVNPSITTFTSTNALLIQFRNGTIPGANADLARRTVARFSVVSGNGRLDVSGSINANQILLSSDSRLKKDIIQIKNSLDIIKRLNPVTYNFKRDEFPSLGLSTTLQYGFIAQEMEKVLPTHVEVADNGYKAINYVMLIPILTKALQETNGLLEQSTAQSNSQILSLEQKVNILVDENKKLTQQLERNGIVIKDETNSNSLSSQFFQNKPNPFTDVTTINYAFKQDGSYKIIVTDLTGKKIKEYANLTGSGEIKVSKDDLPSAGIYLYSLITSGGEIAASKQLIFEK
jgi:hypothetical protein